MTRAAEKLRRSHVAAGVLTVFLMTNRFTDEPQYSNSVTMPLPVATQDTAELIRYALRGALIIASATLCPFSLADGLSRWTERRRGDLDGCE